MTDKGLFIHHTGKEYPGHPDDLVEVIFANGGKSLAAHRAHHFVWGETATPQGAIIAYRIVQKHRAPVGVWAVVDTDSGAVIGSYTSHETAKRGIRGSTGLRIAHLVESIATQE